MNQNERRKENKRERPIDVKAASKDVLRSTC
jgi:hypothetical protein